MPTPPRHARRALLLLLLPACQALAACQTLIDVDHPLRFDAATAPDERDDAAVVHRDAEGDAWDALRPPARLDAETDAASGPGDVSLRPPLPEDFRLPPRPDAAPDPPDLADPPDAPAPPPVEDCHDTVDNDDDLLADCADPDCIDEPCDDAEACTFDDRCEAEGGVCRGTAVTCESDPCMLRGCTGGPACGETPADAGTPCPDDGDPCTADTCDGGGRCGSAPRPDGAQCRGDAYEFRCCGGACVNVFTDDAHCGGCGISCGGRGCVADAVGLIPRISCNCANSNAQCLEIHPDYTCYQNRCNCLSDAACGPGMQCVNITNSPNTCLFP